MLEMLDVLRRMQGEALGLLGFGPTECRYRVVETGPRWRLREYVGGAGAPLLIIAAPIKRPYIWDLAPSVSAVRLCLRNHLRVFLLEWMSPSRGDKSAGLADYAGRSIGQAVRSVSQETGGAKPFLMGHSLGGTLAAIYGALDSPSLRGLVLLASPLCFETGSSRFRDALVSITPPSASDAEIVPGSLLSQLSAMASPETFVWSRWIDAGLSMIDRNACEVHARVERWALDEFPLPGRLVQEILQWLYRENRFCTGTLRIGDKIVGPSCLRIPTLGVVNTADRVAPTDSIVPFIEGMPAGQATIIEHAGEIGVSLQHLAILIGREAHASAWPKIVSWLRAHT